jgi:hypothetical protein
MLQIADNLQLPPEAMTLTSAILGIRGSGKTNTGVVFTEELLEQHQQVIVIDPLDVWWGLKSSSDGAAPGYAIVVLGGARGDLPLSASDGAAIADLLVENRIPAILSLRHLRKGEQKRFVADFAEQLYQRKGETGKNTPCLVVIDEASSFVPQGFQADSARMVGAIEDLVRRGRASGLGVMLIDQRAASVNKDVLTQLELLVAHRHTSPQDRAALKLWVQAHDTGEMEKTFMESLASLPRGQAWFWSPGWLGVFERVTVRKRRTFDSSATPELGAAVAAPEAFASVDLEVLRERLAATIEEAQNSDPATLRRRVQELEARLKARPVETREVVKEVPVLAEGEVERLETQAHDLIAMSKDLHSLGAGILSRLEAIGEGEASPGSVPVWLITSRPDEPPQLEAQAEPKSQKEETESWDLDADALGNSTLSTAQRRVLTVLAHYPQGRNKKQIALLAGYSAGGGSFNAVLARMRSFDWIGGASGHYFITEAGKAALGYVEPLPTGTALRERWHHQLNTCESAILLALTGVYPQALTRAQIAAEAGYEARGGSFNAAISKLKTLDLVEGKTAMKLDDTLAGGLK